MTRRENRRNVAGSRRNVAGNRRNVAGISLEESGWQSAGVPAGLSEQLPHPLTVLPLSQKQNWTPD